MITLFKYFNNF